MSSYNDTIDDYNGIYDSDTLFIAFCASIIVTAFSISLSIYAHRHDLIKTLEGIKEKRQAACIQHFNNNATAALQDLETTYRRVKFTTPNGDRCNIPNFSPYGP